MTAFAAYLASNPAFEMLALLGALAFLIAAVVMLRSAVFGRVTAWVGIVFGVLSLVPASAGALGIVLSLASLVPMLIWLALIARRLLQLGRGDTEPAPGRLRAAGAEVALPTAS